MRFINTRLYTDIAENILNAVISQWSDGWGEDGAYMKYWKFASIVRGNDNEVLIRIEDDNANVWNGRNRFIYNGFCEKSDQEIRNKFAYDIKKTVKMFDSSRWSRDCYVQCNYIDAQIDQAYLVYEVLLNRFIYKHYDEKTINEVVGNALDPATVAKINAIIDQARNEYGQMEETVSTIRKNLVKAKDDLDNKAAKEISSLYDSFKLKYGDEVWKKMTA